MERFKVCEKEMKTKAFSKEGLGQATKLDPREKARNEMRDWINETVDKLTAEVRNTAGCPYNTTTLRSCCMHSTPAVRMHVPGASRRCGKGCLALAVPPTMLTCH